MPKISVIVPVYKVEPFIHRCVDSILAQSYADFTLILVDDGSPDSCGDICDDYAAKDSRIHVIHQKNGGLSAARNTGIDWAMGNSDSQWLAFVDSDDWVHPDYLRLLLEAAEQENCSISACGFYRSAGEPIPEDPREAFSSMEAEDYYCGECHDGITAVAWNKLYHRSVLKKLRYPVGKLHEDEFTTYRAIFAAGRIAVMPVRLYAYYQNPNGIMNAQWSPKRMHMLEAFDQQIAFAREMGYTRLLYKALEGAIYSTGSQLDTAQKVFRKELRQRLRKLLKQGRETDSRLGYSQLQWAYEAAYPCKVFWWLASKVRSL